MLKSTKFNVPSEGSNWFNDDGRWPGGNKQFLATVKRLEKATGEKAAKVRYTSLSLPYHIGNGIFGGLLPLIGLSLSASTGNIYAGLYYPIAIAALCFVCGVVLLKETGGTLIWNEVAPQKSL